ncbi:EamA-like transporter [Ferriphaselus amnicola]|uniref:EamA-like transporter n=1 Tax=Ferriphaselus amnicola TaxID=1188319 RepID=A0A2Z6GDH6_9PROT|nr:DMT family transporter [Ferriphaselus amnicola]BBE51588.1 EamA-like transporter [Ferriphaselus amnicola]
MASKQKVVAVIGLVTAAMVWGLIWYPYRVLDAAGVSGMAATVITYTFALSLGVLLSGSVWREWRVAGWIGILLPLTAGWSNLGYVLGMLDGEVMRVLLLFYLAPLWTVGLSRLLLNEQLNRYGYAVAALSLAGAIVMLWEPHLGWPWPQNQAEWFGLSAGLSFALANVLVRRADHLSVNYKSSSIWLGTALITMLAMLVMGRTHELLSISPDYFWLLGLLGVVLCAASFIVQFGLTHLPANQSIVLFLSELVFAAIAAYFLAGESMGVREIIGAVLIVSASLMSGKMQSGDS